MRVRVRVLAQRVCLYINATTFRGRARARARLFMRARWLVAHRLRKDASVTLDGARDGGDRVRARTCPRAQTSHTRARAR